jgi:hypothetical protein
MLVLKSGGRGAIKSRIDFSARTTLLKRDIGVLRNLATSQLLIMLRRSTQSVPANSLEWTVRKLLGALMAQRVAYAGHDLRDEFVT